MQNFPERVVSALSSGKVEFIVVGAVSAVLQGAPIVTTVKVPAVPDLIRTKRAAGRPKDPAVLPVLEATLQMLQDRGGA